jgi:hypothetical protein
VRRGEVGRRVGECIGNDIVLVVEAMELTSCIVGGLSEAV